MMENIVAVLFDVESEAYQAFSELKKFPVGNTYVISEMGLVKIQNERPVLLEAFDSGKDTVDDSLAGGLVGSLIGILGGPLGVLLGGSIGTLTGMAVDTGDAVKNMSMLERVSEKMYEGETVLTVLVQETDEPELDGKLDKFKTTILRFDAAIIAEEVEKAAQMQKEMSKEAKRKLREEKSSERRQAVEQKRAKLQAEFEAFKQKISKK